MWLGQVQDAELGGAVNAVAAALIRFHNALTGLTCPSLNTLARVAGFSERSVRTALRSLESHGLLIVTRRRARTSLYGLVLKPAPLAARSFCSQSPPHTTAPVRQEAPRHPAPVAAKQGKEPFTDRKDKATPPADLDTERLVRRIQQTSRSPWRLDNARRTVLEAIDRAGVEGVRTLADELAQANLRAWEVIQRLDALAPPSPPVAAPSPAPRPGSLSAPHPSAAFALRLMGQADPTRRRHWHQRASEIGATAPMHDPAGWVPAIAADFLSTEHSRAWTRLQGLGR